VKYGPAGQTITVGTRVAGDGRAQVWVDDQGSGIPGRDKARIWEPFRRLDRAVEAGISGNGIGLAVVRELVAAQGGLVTVHDAPSGGARFMVTLRVAGAREGGEEREASHSGAPLSPAATRARVDAADGAHAPIHGGR
jgi:signal transduction histidine kinase